MELENPARRVFFGLEYEEVFDGAVLALALCGFEVKEADELSGRIIAAAPVSRCSWGEIIKVSVSMANERVIVDAHSKPRIPVQIDHWGKNKRNINDFFAVLTIQTQMRKTSRDQEE